MSLIPHQFMPRSLFNMEMWPSGLEPNSIDFFDPFDELDHMMARHMHWFNRPDHHNRPNLQPKVSHKYRIKVDCKGFGASSIHTEISEDKAKLIVKASETERNSENSEDYSHHEFHRSYDLPKNAEPDKMASFMTSGNHLVIEIPLRDEAERGDLFPRIVDGEHGAKSVEMNMSLPEGLDPSKVKVTCKDHDVIVQAEDKHKCSNDSSKTYYYRRCTLPENADFKKMECTIGKNNMLSVKAPLDMENRHVHNSLPVEIKNGKNN